MERVRERTDSKENGDSDVIETANGVDHAVDRMNERGEEVRDRELERALDRLEARDDLSEKQREVVAALSERLVEKLLAVPEMSLRAGAQQGELERVETALELFEQ